MSTTVGAATLVSTLADGTTASVNNLAFVAVPAPVVDPATTAQPTPAQEAKTGVADFEAAYKFVVAGIEQLGAGAEDELKALAKKYL
ncbi:DUF1177 domain-containing protein [Martelella alba]|uniref:DUF1177 domain-containing protein n=1 Tax=Martelella alba TaxID=2590451 RepID=A0ABY2SEC5_9HYPH|nr:DUF1177 domain-containing protein [Martelella alba]